MAAPARLACLLTSTGALMLLACTTTTSTPAGGWTGSPCPTATLAIRVQALSGGLDHDGAILVFQNNGRPCTMSGYPNLTATVQDTNQVIHARHTPAGYLGGLPPATGEPVVHLTTGQSASALYEGLLAPPKNTPPCPKYTTLLVTPPHNTQPAHLLPPGPGPLCDLQIHPVTAGVTGLANTPPPTH